MIRYALKCRAGHDFESWFQSSEAFDRLKAAGHVVCAVCGVSEVKKAIMAPGVATSSEAPREGGGRGGSEPGPLSKPAHPAEAALAELRRKIESNSEYVGRDFAAEARRIHEGEADRRSIYGEASREEARGLVEDGVPVAPLPFVIRRSD